MKKLSYILTSKFFWITIVIICISLLIWFYGSLLSIGDTKPLYAEWTRALLIAFIVGFFIIRAIWKKLRQAKINDDLIDEMQAAQEPMLKHEHDNSTVRKQFEEIDKLLRNAKFNNRKNTILGKYFNGQYLYQMPWYIVLGDTDSGKSTLLKHSGLNFPLESTYGSSINGLAGTKDCSWFLSDDAVWLDTAGRFAIQNDSQNDVYDWQEFLNQLQHYRPKQPVNGALVTVSVEQLLSPDDELLQTANQLRKRISEMYSQFEIKFPVYLIITKLDHLKGFEEFFNNIPQSYHKQTVGFEIDIDKLDEDDNIVLNHIVKKLQNIKDSLDSSYLHLIDELDTSREKLALTTFSNDFELLNKRLLYFCEAFYKSSKFETNSFWRGIYFTSAKQDGIETSPEEQEIVEEFSLNKNQLNTHKDETSNKSYFIQNLLVENIIKEARLAEFNTSWSYRFRSYRWIPLMLTSVLILGLMYLLFNSYLQNRNYLNAVQKKSTTLHDQFDNTSATHNILQAVIMAKQIQNVSYIDGIKLKDLESPPLSYRFGLYKGKSMKQISESTYQRALRKTVLPMIHHRIDFVLRESVRSDTASSYDTLRAYIMLYEPDNYDKESMRLWVLNEMKADLSALTEKQQADIDDALNYLLDKEIIAPSLPYDSELVKEARQQNTKHDLAHMILENTYNQIERDIRSDQEIIVEPISFLTMGGNGTRQVFTAKDDHSLSEFVDYKFTRDVYEKFVLPEIERRVKVIANEEDWVLGEYSSKFNDKKKTLEQVKRTYYQQYINEWDRYLNILELKQPSNLVQAKEYLKVLSDEHSSPLLKMIVEINYNTSLGSSNQMYNQITDKITETTDSFTDKASNIIDNTFGDDDNEAINSSNEVDSDASSSNQNDNLLEDARSANYEMRSARNEINSASSQLSSVKGQISNRDVYGLANQNIENIGSKTVDVIDVKEGTVKTLVRTLVDEKFIDYSNLVGKDSNEESNMDEIIKSIDTLYEYIDSLNFAIDKGVDLPGVDPVMEFRASISRLPMPFQGMFDNLTENILELWYIEGEKRQQEKDRKEQALKDELEAKEQKEKTEQEQKEQQLRQEQEDKEQQLRQEQEDKEQQLRQEQEVKELLLKQEKEAKERATEEEIKRLMLASINAELSPVSESCKEITDKFYPFVKDGSDVSYNNFAKVFGSDGYPAVDKLEPQIASLAGVNSLVTLSQMNSSFSRYTRLDDMLKINRLYFAPQNQNLGFNFKMSVLELDETVEKLSISYSDEHFEYSHGPIPEFDMSWPPDDNESFLINLYIDNEIIGSLKKSGKWSIFKLIEEGEIVDVKGKDYLIKFNIKGYDFLLKLTQNSRNDLLNLNNFRNLQCL